MAIPTINEEHDDMNTARPRERLEGHNRRFGLDDINPDLVDSSRGRGPSREALSEGIAAEAFDQGRRRPPVAKEELDGFSEGPLPPV
jgi:hypothetical protein